VLRTGILTARKGGKGKGIDMKVAVLRRVSDGSALYDVELSQDESSIVWEAADEEAAYRLADLIRTATRETLEEID
jgi:hypothetical protein